MNINFKDIGYLKSGNSKQRKVYRILNESKILETLKDFHPLVVGTIPIGIDLPESDVDIILESNNLGELKKMLLEKFNDFTNFQFHFFKEDELVCTFEIEDLPFEIYATNLPTEMQNGYLHMLKEYEIIQIKDSDFIHQIKELKRKGMKTEPAFCQLLGIKGNPYDAILNYKI